MIATESERESSLFLLGFFLLALLLVLVLPILLVSSVKGSLEHACEDLCAPHDGTVWDEDCYCKIDGARVKAVEGP